MVGWRRCGRRSVWLGDRTSVAETFERLCLCVHLRDPSTSPLAMKLQVAPLRMTVLSRINKVTESQDDGSIQRGTLETDLESAVDAPSNTG